MIHLLAELIENATLFSPSDTRVEVRAERVANGFAIEIDDRGLGIEPDQLNEINQQLATPPDFDLANADRLGLFVGGKLAARHGVRVSLRPSPYGGTTAIVLMPKQHRRAGRPDGRRPAAGRSPGDRPTRRAGSAVRGSAGPHRAALAAASAFRRRAAPASGHRTSAPAGRPDLGQPEDRRYLPRSSPPHPPGELVAASAGQPVPSRPLARRRRHTGAVRRSHARSTRVTSRLPCRAAGSAAARRTRRTRARRRPLSRRRGDQDSEAPRGEEA